MKALVTLSAAVALAVPTASLAAVCADRTPVAITAPAPDSAKCQGAINKSAQGFLATKLKTLGKCMEAGTPGACPSAKDTDKITKAAIKAVDKISKACAENGVQAGLANAYGSLTDETQIGSCTLSQHNATGDVLLGELNGTPNRLDGSDPRMKCAVTINKAGVKHAIAIHQAMNKCIAAQTKLDTPPANLAPVCLGSWSGGVFTPPSDQKTADALSKNATKLEDSIQKDCGTLNAILRDTIFACAGATSVTDFKNCAVCGGRNAALDAIQQANSETGTLVLPGSGALQTAVNAAAVGAKLLLASGTFDEEITISTDGLQLVGCGGATNARPRIVPPGTPGPHINGIFASSVDGLVFQSLQVGDDGPDPAVAGDGEAWDENGIFITGANGVTFRDIVGEGDRVTTYAVFPVVSSNVLVETSLVTNIRDAGIYVGQSQDIIVRYNTVTDNVAGTEIENSLRASVHNNYHTRNAGGLLVFQLPSPPLQQGADHEVFFNVSNNNNSDNYGIPGSTVASIPDGTGYLVITNKTSEFHHNVAKQNFAIGFGLLDQVAVNAFTGPIFVPTSPDQECTGNLIRNNDFAGNNDSGATALQNPTPPNSPIVHNIVFALGDDQGGNHNNCFTANAGTVNMPPLTASDCTP